MNKSLLKPINEEKTNFLKKSFNRSSSFVVVATIVGSFLYLLSVSWLRWGDLFVDTSRELWLPLQLLKGKVLYRDLFYPYGFFPPYFQAFLYRIFGVHILTQVGCGITLTLAMSFLLFKIARFFLGKFVSCFVVVTFLFVFAFGYYYPSGGIFNFILPYSFAAVFLIVFACLSLYLFLQFVFFEKERYLLLWGIALTFAFFSRIIFGLMLWAGFAVVWAALIFKKRYAIRYSVYLFFPITIGLIGYALFIATNAAFAGFKESIIDIATGALRTMNESPLHSFFKNLPTIAASFFEHIGVISVVAVGCCAVAHFFRRGKKSYGYLLFGGAMIVFSLVLVYRYINAIAPFTDYAFIRAFPQFYCVTILFFVFVPWLFIRVIVCPYDKKRFSLFVLFFISFVMTLRTFPYATPYGKGFTEFVLAMVCYYVFFFDMVGAAIKKYIPHLPRKFFSFVLVLCFMLPLAHFWKFSRAAYLSRTEKIVTDYGVIYSYGSYGKYIGLKFLATIDYLKNEISADESVVVFPHGVSLNLFSRRENPTRYYDFDAVATLLGEERIVPHIKQFNIDYFVIVRSGAIVDYKKTYNWILDNYFPICVMGPEEKNEPVIGIFKRRASPDRNKS